VWHPPKTKPHAEKPYQDLLCGFLDDVILELLALIQQRPKSEKIGSSFPNLPPSAVPDILYALEANDCSYMILLDLPGFY
jgi:ubiquitin carboxyl-terminal hydrolase 25/28